MRQMLVKFSRRAGVIENRFQVINTDAKMCMLLKDYLLHLKIWSLENVPVWLQSHKSTKVFSQIEIIINTMK